MLMNTDAKKKMFAFWDRPATKESFAQEPAQLNAKMDKFFVTELLIIPIPYTKAVRVKMFATWKPRTKLVYTALLILHLIYAPKPAHQKKFCASLMILHWDAKVHTHVKPDQRTTWMNTVPALLIAQFTAKQMNSTAQPEKMKMDANYPINVLKRNEDSMENCAHSIAQKNVTKVNYSVLEVLMKLDAKLPANVETKKNTNGDQELQLNPKLNALDTAHPNVLLMKSFAHHS